jgi:hypothetical protein
MDRMQIQIVCEIVALIVAMGIVIHTFVTFDWKGNGK